MNKKLALTLGLVLVASSALASNTGFKLNYGLTCPAGKSCINWVSVPYFFFPNGNVGQTPQNSIDLCFDANGAAKNNSKVLRVEKFDSNTDRPTSQSCTSVLKAFDIKAGEAYSYVAANATIQLDIVGSHDDSYSSVKGGTQVVSLICPAGKSCINWVSVPYHVGSPTVKAENSIDLCTIANGAPKNNSKVLRVERFDSTTDRPTSQSCTSVLKAFDVKPGEGYSFVAASAGIGLDFPVY